MIARHLLARHLTQAVEAQIPIAFMQRGYVVSTGPRRLRFSHLVLVLDALGAALIGFAVLGARKPNAFGTLIGALLIAVLLNAPYYTQDFVKGLVLVLALVFTFGFARERR